LTVRTFAASIAAMSLEFVESWGGFESFIAELHKTGDVTIQRNVKLVGLKGEPRQIDVLVLHKQGLYEHKIIVERKYWKSRIKRLHVDAMIEAVHDLQAAKGVFFTTKGFQSGAVGVASKSNIDLFLVRDLSATEWGEPGREIHFYIQYFFRTPPAAVEQSDARFVSPCPFGLQSSARSAFNGLSGAAGGALHFDIDIGGTETQLYSTIDGRERGVLETIIDEQSARVLREVYDKADIFLPVDKPSLTVHARGGIRFEPIRVVPIAAGGLILRELIISVPQGCSGRGSL
jgi:hypothetical protein